VGIAATGFCYPGGILQLFHRRYQQNFSTSTRSTSFAAADSSINRIASSRLISFGSLSTLARHRQSLLHLRRCGRQDQHHEDQEEKSKFREDQEYSSEDGVESGTHPCRRKAGEDFQGNTIPITTSSVRDSINGDARIKFREGKIKTKYLSNTQRFLRRIKDLSKSRDQLSPKKRERSLPWIGRSYIYMKIYVWQSEQITKAEMFSTKF
jgi:hypothetical protein